MIELKQELKKMGETFTQLLKDKDDEIVIYKTTFPSVEVFRYRVHKPDKYHTDDYEVYPSSEAFGDWAWCATSLAQFERILMEHFALTSEKCEICRGVWPF